MSDDAEAVGAELARASEESSEGDEMEMAELATAASLPRFISMEEEGLAGKYLTVEMYWGSGPFLTFSAQSQTRLAAHELQWNADEKGVVAIRAGNGRFWRRDPATGFVLPDREAVPLTPASSDPDCYFRLYRLPSSDRQITRLVLQAYGDSMTFLQRDILGVDLVESRIPGISLVTAQANDRDQIVMHVTSAVGVAVVLPRYIMFKGNNDRYMGYYLQEGKNWLKFQYKEPVLAAVQEVFQLVNGNVVMRNVERLKFWKRIPNWIRADVDELADAAQDVECQFDVVKLSSTMLALVSVANKRLLKRYSDYWDDCLCANGDSVDDTTTRLLLQEAVLSRKLTDVRFLLQLAEVSEVSFVVVGTGSVVNNTELTTDLQVQVTLTQQVTNTETWSTSTTFSVSDTVTVTAGVPEVATVEGSITVGVAHTFGTELGTTKSTALQFQTTYVVKDVSPHTQAKVSVECTVAKCRVPFTYTRNDVRVDGIELPAEPRIDGIFEGVNAFNIRGVISSTATGSDNNSSSNSNNNTSSTIIGKVASTITKTIGTAIL